MEEGNVFGRMPVLFVGHGSPMNAIEDNTFTRTWEQLAQEIPRPKAILAVSAHWYTAGTHITMEAEPKMVYDMYGFPEALYRLQYPVKGAPELAKQTASLINREVLEDDGWGIDHGTWSVLCRMYPEADIPVYQLSVDRNGISEEHYNIGKALSSLREQGVLILGSGNVVHNLSRLDWDSDGGHPWADEFDNYIKEKILKRQYEDVLHYEKAGASAKLAFFTPDHFYPLLYILGASQEEDTVKVYNDVCTLGAISMTCYLFQ